MEYATIIDELALAAVELKFGQLLVVTRGNAPGPAAPSSRVLKKGDNYNTYTRIAYVPILPVGAPLPVGVGKSRALKFARVQNGKVWRFHNNYTRT